MSTRVTPAEWGTLIEVPRKNYKSYPETDSGACAFRCDVEPSHGMARMLMQTPDHRAIALCNGCYREVKQAQS